MSASLDSLTAQVAAHVVIVNTAIDFLHTIPALIAAAGSESSALDALSASIKDVGDNLQSAVAAAQPAAPVA